MNLAVDHCRRCLIHYVSDVNNDSKKIKGFLNKTSNDNNNTQRQKRVRDLLKYSLLWTFRTQVIVKVFVLIGL